MAPFHKAGPLISRQNSFKWQSSEGWGEGKHEALRNAGNKSIGSIPCDDVKNYILVYYIFMLL